MAISGSIFVFISYSHRDREWRDRIASSLERAGLGILDDTSLLAGQDWAEELEKMRETARVAILVVTANSLGSFTIQSKELPHLVALQKANGLRLIPVIAKPSLWQKSETISSIQVFPESGTPLSTTPNDIEKELERLAQQIIRLVRESPADAEQGSSPVQITPLKTSPTLSSPPASYSSPPASYSSPPASYSSPPASYSSPPASYSSPPTSYSSPPASYSSPVGTSEQISSSAPKSEPWLSQGDIDSFSPEVREIFGGADQIRRERKIEAVTIGVLLLSLARQQGGQLRELLKDTNIDPNEVFRIDHYNDVPLDVPSFPPMSRHVRRVLIGARDKARGLGSKTIDESHILFVTLQMRDHPLIQILNMRGISSDQIKFEVAPEPAINNDLLAGVQSDTPGGDDLLDITPEVNALASVLAAKDADPPLALGLFGEWGSGKSFFMGRLEGRIRALQDDAQEARKAGAESSYCEHIVQLTFNAWNYIDTNLWASLATEIFEGLASAVAKRRGGDSREERALVLAAASSSQEVLAETERKKSAAEEELKQTQQQLAILQNNQNNIETSLSPSELFKQAYRFAIAQDEVKSHIENAAKELKVNEGMSAAADIKAEILELRGFWTTLRFTLHHGNLWVWFLVFAAVLGAALGIRALVKGLNLSNTANSVVGILTAVSGFLGMFRLWARKALDFIQKAQKSKQELIEKKKQEEAAELQKQYKEVQERVKQAAEAVDSAKQTVNKITKQLESMRADRQMADYIRQRNESTDYTQHLGIIARVRTDFRHLSILLQDVRAEAEKDFLKLKQRQKEMEAERQQAKQAERLKEAQEKRAEGIPEERAPQSTSKAQSLEKDGPADKEDKLFPHIDRIILYIDDLDRCPEKNVVEVLQAVHLLLAFPLFIVVVGVDPRWLLRSLETQSAVFGTSENNGKAEREEDPLWQSTPMNYLEKIFQIPFTLRPLNKDGFGNLVEKFAAAKKQETGQTKVVDAKASPPAAVAAPASTAGPPAGLAAAPPAVAPQIPPVAISQPQATPTPPASQPTGAVLQPVNHAQAQTLSTAILADQSPAATPIDRNPAHLQIEDWERAFMKTLHELIPSPRAGKRFINIYRLLRASVADSGRKKFIGNTNSGDYRAVQMLPAILTGYPAEATEILGKLIEESHEENWGQFRKTLKQGIQAESMAVTQDKTAKSAGSTRQRTTGKDPATKKVKTDAAALGGQRWTELFDKLDRLENNLNDMSCKPFCDWATQIARYSFQSGRVMLYQRD